MIDLEQFTDLPTALAYLHAAGFTHTFQCTGNQVHCLQSHSVFSQDQFSLVAYHRLRYGSQNAQRVVLYAIENFEGIKGVVLDDCQSYGDPALGDFLVKIKMCQLPVSQSIILPKNDQRTPVVRKSS